MDDARARYEPADELRRVIRPTAGRVWLALTVVIALGLLIDVTIRSGWTEALLIAPWPLLLVWFVYVFSYAPHVVADETGVTVHNILRITRIPWGAIADIVVRWQLEFHLTAEAGGRTIQSWAVTRRRPRGRTRDQPAEVEADIVREMRLNADVSASDRAVTARWDGIGVVAFVVLAAWAAVAVALTV